jgi:hypothetical protein
MKPVGLGPEQVSQLNTWTLIVFVDSKYPAKVNVDSPPNPPHDEVQGLTRYSLR